MGEELFIGIVNANRIGTINEYNIQAASPKVEKRRKS